MVSQALAAGAVAGTGAAGWLSSWSLAGKMALAGGAVVLVAGLGLLWKGKPGAPGAEAPAPMRAVGETGWIGRTDISAAAGAITDAAAKAQPATHSGLELFFVDDRTGHPITNQIAWLRGWDPVSHELVEKAVPLPQARCVVPFDPTVGPGLWVFTHVEGYADVMLRWMSSRGDVIPDSYLVRLVKPVLMHGRVLDPEGRPLAGAEVVFGNGTLPGNDSQVESREVLHLTTITDAAGRWQIDRIAPEVLRHLLGSASHPDYLPAERLNLSLQSEAAQQLLDGTYAFRLLPGIAVEGTVVDMADRPIAGALVHVGRLAMTASRNAHSGRDGRFRVGGCPPGEQPITASAEGFGPAALSLNIEPDLAPVTLKLGAGQPLRVRVVDASGSPITGARLWYDAFGRRSDAPIPQIEFSRNSDSDGRIVWEHAPDRDLEFDCSAEGFMRASLVAIHPDGQEHTITLSPALTISGSVRDAGSGEPIPRFQMYIGLPERQPDGSVGPSWGTGMSQTFGAGKFQQVLQAPVVTGRTNRGYILRFQAEGYEPFVTRVFRADEGQVQLDVKLSKAAETAIAIYTPAGHAAAYAQAALLAPGSNLRLVGSAFNANGMEGSPWLRTADAQGHFVLPTDPAVQTVALVHPEGFVQCAVADLRQAQSARLQAWGSVEGVWLKDGQPVAQRQVSLQFSSRKDRSLQLDSATFRTLTDEEGHFAFAQVPAGQLDVLTWHPPSGGQTNTAGSRGRLMGAGWRAASVQVQPGQTSQVTLNGDADPRKQNRMGGDVAP